MAYGGDGVLLIDALEFALATLRDQSQPALAAKPVGDDDLTLAEAMLRSVKAPSGA